MIKIHFHISPYHKGIVDALKSLNHKPYKDIKYGLSLYGYQTVVMRVHGVKYRAIVDRSVTRFCLSNRDFDDYQDVLVYLEFYREDKC